MLDRQKGVIRLYNKLDFRNIKDYIYIHYEIKEEGILLKKI